jgi:hypothetical protein
VGSAVIVFLSLKCVAPSRISVAGLLQVRPPSVDRLTSIAFAEPAINVPTLVESAIWNETPSGLIVTQGSVARS